MEGVVYCGYVMMAELIVCRIIVSQLQSNPDNSNPR